MKFLRISLCVLVLLAPLFAQQVNTNITPSSPGLNIGTPTQRWNGNFDTLNVNTLTVNGVSSGGSGGGSSSFTCTGGVTAIPFYNGTITLCDPALTDDGLGNFGATSLTATTGTFGTVNSTGPGFTQTFKTQTAPSNPAAGFMTWYGDSGTNQFTCLNPDGSLCNPPPAGAAGGDLGSTFPNPTVTKLHWGATGITLSSTAPTSGQFLKYDGSNIVGAAAAGGSASPACSVVGSSDTITTATTFATTCSLSNSGLIVGSFIEIEVHGLYSTTGTASPLANFQVNAGGTTGICNHSGTTTLGTTFTNTPWSLVCYIQLATTGAPGTAIAWGKEDIGNSSGAIISGSPRLFVNTGTVSFTTTSAQTVSVQETATPVSGQSFTLQSLIVRNY